MVGDATCDRMDDGAQLVQEQAYKFGLLNIVYTVDCFNQTKGNVFMDSGRNMKEKIWVPVPPDCNMSAGAILGAWLNPGEKVEWHYSYTLDGRMVIGYTILFE